MRNLSIAFVLLLGLTSPAAAFALKSPDIAEGAPISLDQVYTRCGGQNISPALQWSGAPAGTKSFVLTLIDLDVKPAEWSHWIVVDLPAQTSALARGDAPPSGAHAVTSDFGDAAYDGPCPPVGSGVHHYRFTIWAMPTPTVSVPAGTTAAVLSADLARQAIGSASLTGHFER